MIKSSLPLLSGLFMATSLYADNGQQLYCDPIYNPVSISCVFRNSSDLPLDTLHNVIIMQNHYKKMGQTNHEAAYHAINLELIKQQTIHLKNIEYLEQLWRDIEENRVVLD